MLAPPHSPAVAPTVWGGSKSNQSPRFAVGTTRYTTLCTTLRYLKRAGHSLSGGWVSTTLTKLGASRFSLRGSFFLLHTVKTCLRILCFLNSIRGDSCAILGRILCRVSEEASTLLSFPIPRPSFESCLDTIYTMKQKVSRKQDKYEVMLDDHSIGRSWKETILIHLNYNKRS